MRIASIGVLAFCVILFGLCAMQPEPASAGVVVRVATWPVRALIPGKRCHGAERKAKGCHGGAAPAPGSKCAG